MQGLHLSPHNSKTCAKSDYTAALSALASTEAASNAMVQVIICILCADLQVLSAPQVGLQAVPLLERQASPLSEVEHK